MVSQLLGIWKKINGVFITRRSSATDIVDFLKELNVLACVEYSDNLSNGAIISLMENDGEIAGCSDGNSVVPVMTIYDFNEEIFEKFGYYVDFSPRYLEKRISLAEEILEFASFDDNADNSFESRSILVTKTPASVFPILGNMQNIKLGVTELESDKRAVFEFDKNTAKSKVLEGCEQPILIFNNVNGLYQILYSPTNNVDDVINFVWFSNVALIYGKCENPSDIVTTIVKEVLSPNKIDRDIADINDKVNYENVSKALLASGSDGISILMSEFDLPVNVIKFLQGKLDIDSAADLVHEPRGYVSAIERSFDTMDKGNHSNFWKKYYNLSTEKPWILNLFAGAVGITGAFLFTRALSKEKPTLRTRLSGIFGILLMVEGIAEYMLNKYIGVHEERNRRENNEW